MWSLLRKGKWGAEILGSRLKSALYELPGFREITESHHGIVAEK